MARPLHVLAVVVVVVLMHGSAALAGGCVFFDPGSTTVDNYEPISGEQRAAWIACGTFGVSSLAIGAANASFPRWFNTLDEWKRAQAGFAERFGRRELNVAVSHGVEGGLGAIWGEEPRYVRLGDRSGLWRRVGYSLLIVVAAQRRNGGLAPAWGRYSGNVASKALESISLPSESSGFGETAKRTAEGYLMGNAVGNLLGEFGPDLGSWVKSRFRR